MIWVRGQGYDPLVPPNDPRARNVRLADEPGLRLPPEDDPDYELWKTRWEQFLRNRAVLRADVEENTGVARTVQTAIDWLERRGGESDPFVLWLDLFSPHGPWDPPQPYRDQYATVEPDEFEAGEEGDLVEESPSDGRGHRHRGRRGADRRPGRCRRRRARARPNCSGSGGLTPAP